MVSHLSSVHGPPVGNWDTVTGACWVFFIDTVHRCNRSHVSECKGSQGSAMKSKPYPPGLRTTCLWVQTPTSGNFPWPKPSTGNGAEHDPQAFSILTAKSISWKGVLMFPLPEHVANRVFMLLSGLAPREQNNEMHVSDGMPKIKCIPDFVYLCTEPIYNLRQNNCYFLRAVFSSNFPARAAYQVAALPRVSTL